MASYTFEELLSPIDFEHLVRDLLSQDLKVELSAFAEGKDSGIDLRYAKINHNEIVVQCKRTKTISKSQLLIEAEKVAKIKPDNYYLVTSCDLSTKKVDQIKEVLKEWIKDDLNIYSKNRLNKLLDKHPDILQKHYKLWLNSAVIFNTLINLPLYERAKALVNDIKTNYKFFVKNEALKKSLEILNDHQFIIISGIPGIGKTTLAKLLLMEYLMNGYEIVEIRKIIEGEQLLLEDSKNKQVFYFDDFLGENFLKYDVIEGRSNDLVQFIKRVMANKFKILIMTTREYILQQAKDRYEKLDSEEFNVYKYTLDLSSYSKRIKTMILYNHLYYSGIGDAYIMNLIKDNTYKKIIAHKNYSPRIIEYMTINLTDIQPQEYGKTFLENLNKPFKIWDKAFNGQISEGAKFTLYILLSTGDNILLSDFRKALNQFNKIAAIPKNYSFNPLDFKNYIRELEGSFIKVDLSDKSNHFIRFQNPSVKDFLLNLIIDNKEMIESLLESAVYYKQLIYTIDYIAYPYIEDKNITLIIKNVIQESFDSFKNYTYLYFQSKELSTNLDTLGKLWGLKNYLNKFPRSDIAVFLFKKFDDLDVTKQIYNLRLYIYFYIEFHDNLKTDFEELLASLIQTIAWIDDAKNITLLNNLNPELYNVVTKKNSLIFSQNLNSAIEKDIEFADSVDSLAEIKTDIEKNKNLWGLHSLGFDEKIDEKIAMIEEKEAENEEPELNIEIDSTDENLEEENFNEEDFFKIDMFK
jgi:hypothetical protein